MPTLFLCGDVMTGRGIDQILGHACPPEIQESYVRDARDYVELAEQKNGPVPSPVGPEYIWGDALAELDRVSPLARVINLETSITESGDYWEQKGIHYRMHPNNVDCLTAARIDVCILANNHVLDYGYAGLQETLDTLKRAGLRFTGAGSTIAEASTPAVVDCDEGRIFVWSVGSPSSGVPPVWAATPNRPGVDFLDNLSDATADALADRYMRVRRAGDIGVASIHWGSNWGYDVPEAQVDFAHRLIDGGIDIVHAHSSHHPRPIEVYKDKLVLYGCGDFLNDYEGISGYEEYRGDLALMYFPELDAATGRLLSLRMVPMRVKNLRLNRVSKPDAEWLQATIDRASSVFGCWTERLGDESLTLRWKHPRR